MQYQTILFDLDGTLVNTFGAVYDCHLRYAETRGVPPPPREAEAAMMTPSLPDVMRNFYGITDAEMDCEISLVRQLYTNHSIQKAALYPGVQELLARCREAGLQTAICTMEGQEQAEHSIEKFGLSQMFDFIRGIDERCPREKSETAEELLSLLQVKDRSRALLFGDALGDARAAHKTGIDFAAALYGSGLKREDTEGISCVFRALSPAEFQAFLFAQTGI